jgi:hypothetical protein
MKHKFVALMTFCCIIPALHAQQIIQQPSALQQFTTLKKKYYSLLDAQEQEKLLHDEATGNIPHALEYLKALQQETIAAVRTDLTCHNLFSQREIDCFVRRKPTGLERIGLARWAVKPGKQQKAFEHAIIEVGLTTQADLTKRLHAVAKKRQKLQRQSNKDCATHKKILQLKRKLYLTPEQREYLAGEKDGRSVLTYLKHLEKEQKNKALPPLSEFEQEMEHAHATFEQLETMLCTTGQWTFFAPHSPNFDFLQDVLHNKFVTIPQQPLKSSQATLCIFLAHYLTQDGASLKSPLTTQQHFKLKAAYAMLRKYYEDEFPGNTLEAEFNFVVREFLLAQATIAH